MSAWVAAAEVLGGLVVAAWLAAITWMVVGWLRLRRARRHVAELRAALPDVDVPDWLGAATHDRPSTPLDHIELTLSARLLESAFEKESNQ